MDDGNRNRVELNLDKTLLERAAEQGLDLSQLVEEALRTELRRAFLAQETGEERTRLLSDIGAEIRSRNAMIEEDGLFGQEWRPF